MSREIIYPKGYDQARGQRETEADTRSRNVEPPKPPEPIREAGEGEVKAMWSHDSNGWGTLTLSTGEKFEFTGGPAGLGSRIVRGTALQEGKSSGNDAYNYKNEFIFDENGLGNLRKFSEMYAKFKDLEGDKNKAEFLNLRRKLEEEVDAAKK